jgi:hypothetical protein
VKAGRGLSLCIACVLQASDGATEQVFALKRTEALSTLRHAEHQDVVQFLERMIYKQVLVR